MKNINKSKNSFFVGILIIILSYGNLFAVKSGAITSPHTSNKKTDLHTIDSQIESLESLKEYYLAKATRLRKRGDRIKYNSDLKETPEAQKYWKSADKYDRISDQIQEEINCLEEEKECILQKQDY